MSFSAVGTLGMMLNSNKSNCVSSVNEFASVTAIKFVLLVYYHHMFVISRHFPDFQKLLNATNHDCAIDRVKISYAICLIMFIKICGYEICHEYCQCSLFLCIFLGLVRLKPYFILQFWRIQYKLLPFDHVSYFCSCSPFVFGKITQLFKCLCCHSVQIV